MEKELVIYCTTCQMWFDTKNGWQADKASFGNGIPVCPACGSVLMQIESDKFYENNRKDGRLEEVMTWEWPNGSFWKKPSNGVKELITVLDGDDYVNDLTKEMDKHLKPGPPQWFHTYLWKDFKEDGVAIRFPGATIGHVSFDRDLVITDIVLYDTAFENCIACYESSVHEAVKQYIGSKIIIAEALPKAKQVEIIGDPGVGRTGLTNLSLAKAMLGNGPYDDMAIPKSKPVRNIIGYTPKNAQGRNEKCACGSGKKYKRCCGK